VSFADLIVEDIMPIRPKRFVEETCQRCRRPGWTHEVAFELLTEDEYEKMMRQPLDKIHGLPAGFESMYVGCGSSIRTAVQEAITYCREYNIKGVGFDFNDEPVFVTRTSDADKVYRDWWQRRYKETPEQSFAKR
jgi:hypothetical protein